MAKDANVFTTDWDGEAEQMGFKSARVSARAGAENLGASVYELRPGASGAFLHAHWANEEMAVVLEGTPTLRTHETQRELQPGDVVAFPRGPAGAHQVWNATQDPVRVLMLSTRDNAEVYVYPDSGKIAAVANRLGSGDRAVLLNRPENNLDYYDGEP